MNCNRITLYCLFILLFVFNTSCFAQDSTTGDSTVSTEVEDSLATKYTIGDDTAVVKMDVGSNDDSILKWKSNPAFAYMAYLDSLLRKKHRDIRSDTFDLNKSNGKHSRRISTASSDSNSMLNSTPVKAFFWLIAIFFIGFILYRLFIKGGLFAKENTKYNKEMPGEEPEELSEYSAYNDLIYDAESKSDFNQAIRYLYLQSLKKLSDRELILFSPDKTNNSYVRALSGSAYQQDFALLTHNYEYVWYGKFLIDKSRYLQIKEHFISFNKKV